MGHKKINANNVGEELGGKIKIWGSGVRKMVYKS